MSWEASFVMHPVLDCSQIKFRAILTVEFEE